MPDVQFQQSISLTVTELDDQTENAAPTGATPVQRWKQLEKLQSANSTSVLALTYTLVARSLPPQAKK
jgi:hypothetical protein